MAKWIAMIMTLCLFVGLLIFGSCMQIRWVSILSGTMMFLESIGFVALLWQQEKKERQLCRQIEQEKESAQQNLKECKRKSVEEQAQFYSAFSHSIRMPLAIIKGYAELLANGSIDREDQDQYLEKIIQKSQSIVDFFPKMQEHLELIELSSESKEPVNLVKAVQQCVQEIQKSMCFDDIRLQVLSTETELLVEINENRINEIVYNLLDNAYKYMQRAGTVTFRMWKADEDIHLLVRDDGMGISKEKTKHIFEKNYQGDNQEANHRGGRGYGLYQVQQIVLAYHGQISADSDVGKGMAIHIIFPQTVRKPAVPIGE